MPYVTTHISIHTSRARPAILFAFTVLATLASLAQQQTPTPAPPTSATPAQPVAAPLSPIDEGLNYLSSNQPARALATFQKILATDPENATANLLAASAALNLYQGTEAVAYAEKAQQLAPNDWRVDTTLVAAYASANKTKERDAERAKLVALHESASAPSDAVKANGFLLDLFKVGNYRVEAVQYFKPIGKFHTYYRFVVRNQANKRVWNYELHSDDLSQKSWAEAHPQEAAAGGRQYSLESAGDTPIEYRLFSGDPGYDELRAVVVRLLLDRTTPFPAELPTPAPAVQ